MKLDVLVSELSLDDTVEVILVDVTKPEHVDAAVKKFKVVINTVGPFMRWGTPVVAWASYHQNIACFDIYFMDEVRVSRTGCTMLMSLAKHTGCATFSMSEYHDYLLYVPVPLTFL